MEVLSVKYINRDQFFNITSIIKTINVFVFLIIHIFVYLKKTNSSWTYPDICVIVFQLLSSLNNKVKNGRMFFTTALNKYISKKVIHSKH